MKIKKRRKLGRILLVLVIIMLCLFLIEIKTNKDSFDKSGVGDNKDVTYSSEDVENLVSQAREEGRRQGVAEVLDRIKTALEEEQTVVAVLKSLYPDQLVVASGGRFNWVDINPDMKKNDFDEAYLVVDEETGLCSYEKDGQVLSKKGIDVSSHQGKIDWSKVKADNVEFAFVRALYRGYGSGEMVVDDYFEKNLSGAQTAGIDTGVYVFSQAISEEEAREEARKILELLDGRKLELPIVFDVERITNDTARMNKLTVRERTDVAKAFLNEIETKSDYDTMIYHNTEMGALLIDLSQFEDYKKWFAGYTIEFYWPYDYSVWQYSEKGKVAGISTAVDLNIWLD